MSVFFYVKLHISIPKFINEVLLSDDRDARMLDLDIGDIRGAEAGITSLNHYQLSVIVVRLVPVT